MSGMRPVAYLGAMLALAALTTTPSLAASTTTATQLTTRFKASTGEKLVVNSQQSYAGHHKAYGLRVPTAFTRAKWGTFTVYLVTGPDVETEVTRLLADTRSGVLGTPSAGNIYWEQGATLQGQVYWQAKRRYGQNVVLTWIGSAATKKTDASWKRLHKALTAATK